MLRAASSIADSKHADQPAAKSCSGLVPLPGLPGRDSVTSRRPSELRDMPARPPVVWTFAVYSTFSSWFISSSFMKSPESGVVRRSQVGKLGKQIGVAPDLVPGNLAVCEDRQKNVAGIVGQRPAIAWKGRRTRR